MGPEGRSAPLPHSVLGTLIFVMTEMMFFSGLVSAFTVARASAPLWPPPDQPRLPTEETAVNTAMLLASGVALWLTRSAWRRDPRSGGVWLAAAIGLGGAFLWLQGREWLALLGQGLTLTSSALGSYFYLIIGIHGLHVVAALIALVYAWVRLQNGRLSSAMLGATEIFWYFVVGVWPLLYWRVYL